MPDVNIPLLTLLTTLLLAPSSLIMIALISHHLPTLPSSKPACPAVSPSWLQYPLTVLLAQPVVTFCPPLFQPLGLDPLPYPWVVVGGRRSD